MKFIFSMFIVISSICAAMENSIKILNIGIAQEFDSLHPILLNSQASQYIYNLINRPLVTEDNQGQIVIP